MPITEHLQPGQLEHELAKVEDRRDPPVPVIVRRDGVDHDALLHGWAANPRGANDGWRGLCFLIRQYAPGFEAELLTWLRAENIRPSER